MQVSSPRAAERIYIKDGVMNDGRIVARKVTLYADAGAYSRHSPYAHDQGRRAHARPVHDPERLGRRLLRLHQPHAVERDARLRRDDRRLRARVADGPDRARARTSTRCELRLKNAYRDGDMKAHRKVAEGTALIEVIQEAAELVGHELPAEYRAMSSHGGALMAMLTRTRLRRRQLPDRHEPRRRPDPGAGARDHDRQLRRHALERRPRPGPEDRRRAGRGRDARRCPTRTSSSTPPTPTPARTAWARSPRAARTASATR